MILPIYAYGQPVLKKMGAEIGPDYPDLEALIANMWETMYNAHGVGLAAPQIGLPIRLFIVDTLQLKKEGETDVVGIKQVFINAEMLEEAGEPWTYEEGCLSIPEIRGDVERQSQIRLRYLDEQFEAHEAVFSGIEARVIQHEYDHIEGRLFTERLKPIRRRRIQRKLESIKKGEVDVEYRMKFALSR
jgi:peptide deformylase